MLQPATRLINRFNLKQKRSLVGAAVLLALAVPLTHLVVKQARDICFVNQERQGVEVVRSLNQTLEQVTALRAGMRGEPAADRSKKAQQALDAAVKALDESIASNDGLALQAQWKTLKPQLLALKSADPARADGGSAYRTAMQGIDTLLALTAERSKLALDPELDSHYLALNATHDLPSVVRYAIEIGSPAPAQQAQAKSGDKAEPAAEENAFGDAFGDVAPAADTAKPSEPAAAATEPAAAAPAAASAPAASAAEASAASAAPAAEEAPPAVAPVSAQGLSQTLTRLEDAASAALSNIDKAAANDPSLKEALQKERRGFNLAFGQYSEAARQLLDNPEQTIKSEEESLHEAAFKLSAANLDRLETKLHARHSSLVAGLAWQLLFCGAMIGLLWLVLSTIYRATLTALNAMTDGVRKIASGELDTTIDLASNDELQGLAQAINRMSGDLRELLTAAQQSSTQLHQEVQTLHRASRELASASSEQTEAAHTMASSIEQLSVSIGQVSEHAQQGAQVSSETSEVSAESSAVIHKMADEMITISESVRTTATAIESLGEHSDKISSVVQVIKEVAGQTNLLALNAAIEAARAGEQGRGFAVVADEVRKLAERTTNSTQEITEIIEAIQDATMNAILAMGSVVAKVNEGVDLANNAGSAITKIRDQGQQTQLVVRDISTALQEQTSTSQLLADTVQKIAAMSASSNQAAQNAAQTAEQMYALASRIQEAVYRFKAE